MSITDLIRLPKLISEVLFQFILMRSKESYQRVGPGILRLAAPEAVALKVFLEHFARPER